MDEFVESLRVAVPGVSERVLSAFREVDRAQFVPAGVDPYTVDDVVVLAQHGGHVTSSISAPWLVARMADELDVRPGMRVLEVGAASGFNAALLATLGGEVTSIEILPHLVEQARERLARLGSNARIEHGDGMVGWPDAAPYDRVIFTCSVARPPAWLWKQTTPRARVVLPVQWGAGSCWTLDRRDEEFACSRAFDCGFVPLVGEEPDPAIEVLPGFSVRGPSLANAGDLQQVDPADAVPVWSGRTVGAVSLGGLWMRLWGHPRVCRTHGTPEGLPRPMAGRANPAITDGGLVYAAIRAAADGFEYGVCSLGASRASRDQLLDMLDQWHQDPDQWPTIHLGMP